jgi:uncharacterized protein YecT (DUF1311 family)
VSKIPVLFASLILAMTISNQAPTRQRDSCFNKATTQTQMNICAMNAYKEADAELNRVYQQLRAKNQGNAEFIEKLRLAEEAWIKFRDAHIEVMYPEAGSQPRAEGSTSPMCKATEMRRLTVERTETLKRMLNPKQGDVCAAPRGCSAMRWPEGPRGLPTRSEQPAA